jgi:hypothetical protein
MARTKYDIANSAIRIFLQDVGRFYDRARGLESFVPKVSQTSELLEFFSDQCCYCGGAINKKSVSLDHLIPMNKASLGLHAWGNVVPCCKDCNNEKQQRPWEEFLQWKSTGPELASRRQRIIAFVESKRYDPNLDIREYAGNLYEDVGEVAMTLIQLRYKQAEAGISRILGSG